MRHKNSYDIIRFIAAGLVVFSHSFALTGKPEPHIGNITLGGFGVWVFFILSGYLIAASWKQYPRFNVFFAKRSLRIFPGLVVAIVFSIIICGLFFTDLGLSSFFRSQLTYSYLNNIFLYNTQYSLPGVFASNIYPSAINGSLWTLAYEFTMYIAVALLGTLGLLRRKSVLIFWAFLLIAFLIITISSKNIFTINIFYLQINLLSMLSILFFSGVVFQHYQKKIKLNAIVGILSFFVFIGLSTLFPKLSALFGCTLLAYSIFSLGSYPTLSWFGKFGDFSYGIYIYSFLIQQIIESKTHTQNSMKMFFASLVISILIAALSWNYVEKKALLLKTRINLKKYPLTQENNAW